MIFYNFKYKEKIREGHIYDYSTTALGSYIQSPFFFFFQDALEVFSFSFKNSDDIWEAFWRKKEKTECSMYFEKNKTVLMLLYIHCIVFQVLVLFLKACELSTFVLIANHKSKTNFKIHYDFIQLFCFFLL